MTHRVQRVQELIRRELGPILERNFSFSGSFVTIHEVVITPDLKQCFVYVGILGKGEERQKLLAEWGVPAPPVKTELTVTKNVVRVSSMVSIGDLPILDLARKRLLAQARRR